MKECRPAKLIAFMAIAIGVFSWEVTRADTLLLSRSFDAAAVEINFGSFTFQAPIDGRLVIEMDNPDGSADGQIGVTNVTTGLGYNYGLFYGTTGDPLFNPLTLPRVRITQGRVHSIYALPVLASWGSCEYTVGYSNNTGTENRGTNSVTVTYVPNPLTLTNAQLLVSLTSGPTQGNYATATFDAGDGGTLLVVLVQKGDGFGGYHSVYLDFRGIHYNNVASPSALMGIHTAIEVGPGIHTLKIRHEDDYWSDNGIRLRQTSVYFSPSRLSEPTGVTIRGTVCVYDTVTDKPLAGVMVEANGQGPCTTDVDGRYEIDRLPPAEITVCATKAGYRSETQFLPYSIASVTDPQKEGPYFYGQYFCTGSDDQNLKLYLIPQYEEVYDVPSFRPITNGFHFRNKNNHCIGISMHAFNLWLEGILPNPRAEEHDTDGWPLVEDYHIREIRWLQLWYQYLPGYAMYPWDDPSIDLEGLCANLNSRGPQLLIWRKRISDGPHAVVVYKVVKGTTCSFIWLYDSNRPELENIIPVYKSRGGWQLDPKEYTAAKLLPYRTGSWLTSYGVVAYSPVTLNITDPDGFILTEGLNEIDGGYYRKLDFNGDGEDDEVVTIIGPKEGKYLVKVIPKPGAEPTATYTLEEYKFGEKTVLAEDVEIQNVPDEPYESIVVYPMIPCEQAIALLDYKLINQNRVSRTEFEYTFRLRAANSGVSDLKDVTVQLVGEPNNTTVLDDTVKFSLIKAGTEALSDDTFKILTDRAIEGSPSNVVWKICDCKMQRRSDFSHDWSVDFRDFATLAEAWLNVGDNMPQDVYPDGKIDVMDLMILSEEWLK